MEMIDQLGEKPRNLQRYYNNTGLKSKKEVGAMIYRYRHSKRRGRPPRGIWSAIIRVASESPITAMMRNRCYRAPSADASKYRYL